MPNATINLQQIITDFSETIFWNNVKPWPAENEEPYSLTVRAGISSIRILFQSGELDALVATLPTQSEDPDAGGNPTSGADAKFIAQLPVYIPFLLRCAANQDDLAAYNEGFQEHISDLLNAMKPFVELVKGTSGNIPTERLSFADWHKLTKAFDAAVSALGHAAIGYPPTNSRPTSTPSEGQAQRGASRRV